MDHMGYCLIISFVCGTCPVSQNTEMETESGNSLFFPLVQPVYMFVYEFVWTIIKCGQILKLLVVLSTIRVIRVQSLKLTCVDPL